MATPIDVPMDDIFNGPPEALIFDCDGTLINTMPAHLRGWRDGMKIHGLTISDAEFYGHAGVGTEEIIRKLAKHQGKEVDVDQVVVDKVRCTDEHFEHDALPVIQPALDVLLEARARNIKVGVASGGDRQHVYHSLTKCDLVKLCDAIVCRDEVENGKPSPDLFLECARRLNVNPNKCVAFEDGEMGMQSIRAAGMKACDVRYWKGYPLTPFLQSELFP